MSLRPVKSEKHETTWSNLSQDASGGITVNLVKAVSGEPVGATEVETGSTVRSIFVEFNLNGVDNSGTAQVFHWYIWKNPASEFSVILPSVYDDDKKRFILKRGMEMLPQIPLGSGGTVQTKRVFVVKIPPRMRRFGENDALQLVYISTSASNINFCGIAIFKEFK